MNIKVKKLETQINQWSCINNFLQKILTRAFFYWLLLPIHADTSFFLIGCMIWQHAVILESIWETDLNITHFPVQPTGRLTPLLTCLLYFSLLLGQNYSKSNSLSPFFFFGQKFSKSNSSSLFSLGENFLSPIPPLSPLGRNYSKSNSNPAKFF